MNRRASHRFALAPRALMLGARAALVFAVAGCSSSSPPVPAVALVARVERAQTTPDFSHAALKVYEDSSGRAGAFIKGSDCVAVAGLPAGSGGRRRLELEVPEGGPYFLQLTGHLDANCTPERSVAAALAPGVTARAGTPSIVTLSVVAVERFVVVNPPAVEDAEVVARAFHTATLADDGSLLIAGGAQEASALPESACAAGLGRCLRLGRATSGVHRFDPGSGALILVGALEGRRFLHSAHRFAGGGPIGRLVVSGGAQSATIAGNGAAGDAPFIRADATCTNPNDAAGTGCILRSVEVHRFDGSAASSFALNVGRANHAGFALQGDKLLVAGGRAATLQPGCTTDAQCAAGAVCDPRGRCLRGGQDCAQLADATQACLSGYTCEPGDAGARCVKRGCKADADCGGCLVSGGCTTGTASVCELATGLCQKRGCSSDSECLGSNRRCLQGNCAQVGCDGLSGCPSGRSCDVRTGKCKPDGASVDCAAAGGACDCRGNGDCGAGFTCQTEGELAGRCRNVQSGCPATVCRRDVNDPAQGPYFDGDGQLRRDVNCTAGQCVLRGCLADVDCPGGSVCDNKLCVSGRRVTAATATTEVCDLSGAIAGARVCQPAAALGASRDGPIYGCAAVDAEGRCTMPVLLGGQAGGDRPGELRDGSGAAGARVEAVGCAVAGACSPTFGAFRSAGDRYAIFGGVGLGPAGAPPHRLLSTAWLSVAGDPASLRLLPSTLPAPRAGAVALGWGEATLLIGGATEGLAAAAATLEVNATGTMITEPAVLRLNTGRVGHTANVLPDGRIVVVGGLDPQTATVASTVEIFTPRSALR